MPGKHNAGGCKCCSITTACCANKIPSSLNLTSPNGSLGLTFDSLTSTWKTPIFPVPSITNTFHGFPHPATPADTDCAFVGSVLVAQYQLSCLGGTTWILRLNFDICCQTLGSILNYGADPGLITLITMVSSSSSCSPFSLSFTQPATFSFRCNVVTSTLGVPGGSGTCTVTS